MSAINSAKVLVVFYSRSGTTRDVALATAQRCGADVEELCDVRSRRGLFGFFRSGREATRGIAAEIIAPSKDIRSYDLVIFGTPVWASHISSPMRGYLDYLKKHAARAKRVAFFCTMGGKGAEGVFSELAELTGTSPIAVMALTAREVAKDRYADRLDSFMSQLRNPTTSVSPPKEFHLAEAH